MSNENPRNRIVEEITVSGHELVDKVKQLIAEGNVRRLIVRKPNGEELIEIPLNAGIAVGGLMTVMAPVLAALGAMAALVANFRVEIVRRTPDEPPKEIPERLDEHDPR
ncbi:DUF4342 domain-containing protein [Thioalkalicoccus limnaeus]|uniref:DUF4342 domain-containing protein n=1 Tax=Thioalkalicoccus limnaeus TaxID=120681 RepID=A0ABV4BJ28_9GAMM